MSGIAPYYTSTADNTGRFIMYSGMYDRKTVEHVFTKPVQIDGTNQKKHFFPQKVVFHRSSHSAAMRYECM
jgi:hypothetical protein